LHAHAITVWVQHVKNGFYIFTELSPNL